MAAEACGAFEKAVDFYLRAVDVRVDDERPKEARVRCCLSSTLQLTCPQKSLAKAISVLVRCREFEKALRQLGAVCMCLTRRHGRQRTARR